MKPEGQAILCLEPRIKGPRHSGGFFYNDCLATAALACTKDRTGSSCPVQPLFGVQTWEGGTLQPAIVLLDSLWWYIHKRPLDILSDALAGRSWGIIMHGLPDESSGLLGDMAEAGFVVVPSFWAAGQLVAVRSRVSAGGRLEVRVLYPGWDGRPGLVPETGRQVRAAGTVNAINQVRSLALQKKPGGRAGAGAAHNPVRIASSSNWTRAKGLVEAACALGGLSENPACPPWIWRAAGTPDAMLLREARDNLASMARRLESLGHLDSGSLVRLLRGTDIFLHPSRQETFCLSVFEAALAGCRIVARDIGGVPEAIHLATLLRSQLSLPPAGVHLAPPGAQAQGEPDRLVLALEEALAASTSAVVDASMAAPVLTTKSAAKYSSGTGRRSSPATRSGLLREFSWLGRLDKLLNGQSDRPLPEMTKPEKVEAS